MAHCGAYFRILELVAFLLKVMYFFAIIKKRIPAGAHNMIDSPGTQLIEMHDQNIAHCSASLSFTFVRVRTPTQMYCRPLLHKFRSEAELQHRPEPTAAFLSNVCLTSSLPPALPKCRSLPGIPEDSSNAYLRHVFFSIFWCFSELQSFWLRSYSSVVYCLMKMK